MRNPFARVARSDTPKPTLRERLSATKAKAKQVLAVNKAILTPLPKPAPAVDRTALVNYASWLAWERSLVCRELYPHMGARCTSFVLGLNAAEQWHFRGPNRTLGAVPAASTRAVKILDMVGVEWRQDIANGFDPDLNNGDLTDTGERPALPYGWPALDSALVEALDDLHRLDRAQEAMYVGEMDRDGDTVPGYQALEDERDGAMRRLTSNRAEGLPGLQAKARAILARSVSQLGGEPLQAIAESLARDLVGARQSMVEPRPDPILATIKECRRLYAAWTATNDLPQPAGSIDPLPEQNAAAAAFHAHVDDVLLKTVPATAAGCAALARFCVEFYSAEGWALDEDAGNDQHLRVLALIDRSPLL